MEIYKRNIEALKKNSSASCEVLETTSVDKEKIIVSHMSSASFRLSIEKLILMKSLLATHAIFLDCPKRAAELLEQQDVKRCCFWGLGLEDIQRHCTRGSKKMEF